MDNANNPGAPSTSHVPRKRGRKPLYATAEERRKAQSRCAMKWNQAHVDKVLEYQRRYYEKHKEAILQRARDRRMAQKKLPDRPSLVSADQN